MEAEKAKLYVGGISRETGEAALREHFGKYGGVSHAVVPKDRDTGSPRSFAFVWFFDPASAKAALGDKEHVILGKKVLVREANRTEHHPNRQEVRLGQNHCCRTCGNSLNGNNTNTRFRSRKIFVGGLPTSLTENEFKTFFERFGKTTDVVIMHDPYRRPRGFGFVTFTSEETAEDVMKNNFYEIHGRLVEVKRAIPKEARNFCYDGCEVNGHTGRGQDYRNYWPLYCPVYATPYGSFHGYGHFSSYHKFGWGSYGAGAYSVSHAVHFSGSGPAYTDNMLGYYGMPIPMYNGFVQNGFDTVTSQAGCVENASNAPALPRIEELKLTDCIDGEAETSALPGIKGLKLKDNGSESDGGSSDATPQDDDH
ncbi:RNA-binding protein 1-like [Rhodamnia argentea]|uniref:RNA-binding protein 1-like n=1 Tax=Rhodamnia argentea TaxID=178133 RepID=A0A8B8P1S5_9MYRT|nr:RNA-binding protein 1-like [Rhodamnia argentea]